MAVFVVDASVALAWCFADERSAPTDQLLERLRQGDQITVPAHWVTEVANALLMGVRRKRIQPEQPELLWAELAKLPITLQPPLTESQVVEVLRLSKEHGLTAYDAAYVELARRHRLSLGTLDVHLRKAAAAEGIALV